MNPVFSCKHITQELEHFKLADITFALNAGCVLGVIGKNGSGKTTLLRTLMGMQSTQGDARMSMYRCGIAQSSTGPPDRPLVGC